MEKEKDGQTLSYGTLPAINGGPIIERIVQIFLGIKKVMQPIKIIMI